MFLFNLQRNTEIGHFPRCSPFGQGQTSNERLHDAGVYYRVFGYARASGVFRNNFGHCSGGKIQDGHHLSDVKQ